MAWVVGTCLLFDVAEADPRFGIASARLLDRQRPDGLLICPVSDIELAPVFNTDDSLPEQFLQSMAVSSREPWTAVDTRAARRAWHEYVTRRHTAATPKRPLADVLIGAFALRFDGILTRNEADFRQLFPTLKVLTP